MSDQPLPSSMDEDFFNENRWAKFTRRLKEEPLVPVGVGLTCWALYSAARSIRSGNGARTNRMFRYRLYAQSFTIVAMLGGSFYYNADRLKRNEYVKLKKKREAQERKEAWIRELEARDAEDKEWRSKLGKVRDAQREEMDGRLLEEKRRLEREEAERKGKAANDDRRGVIEAIRLQSNAAKAKEEKMQAIEAETQGGTLPVGPAPVSDEERAAAQPKSSSLVGESEAGGLFGIGHLKTVWKNRKPKQADDDGNSG